MAPSDPISISGEVFGLDRRWYVTVQLDARSRLVSLQITWTDQLEEPPTGITAQMLRQVSVGEATRWALRGLKYQREQAELAAAKTKRPAVREFYERQLAEHPAPASERDYHLAILAALFLDFCAAGPKPRIATAEYVMSTPTTVRNQLQEAQERGIYQSAGQGRAGGLLTEYGQQLLREGI